MGRRGFVLPYFIKRNLLVDILEIFKQIEATYHNRPLDLTHEFRCGMFWYNLGLTRFIYPINPRVLPYFFKAYLQAKKTKLLKRIKKDSFAIQNTPGVESGYWQQTHSIYDPGQIKLALVLVRFLRQYEYLKYADLKLNVRVKDLYAYYDTYRPLTQKGKIKNQELRRGGVVRNFCFANCPRHSPGGFTRDEIGYWLELGYYREDAYYLSLYFYKKYVKKGEICPALEDRRQPSVEKVEKVTLTLNQVVETITRTYPVTPIPKSPRPKDSISLPTRDDLINALFEDGKPSLAKKVITPVPTPASIGAYGFEYLLKQQGLSLDGYCNVVFKYKKREYTAQQIANFLGWIIERNQLPIGRYFEQIQPGESIFLVAATGLGKTVTLPVYLLAQLMIQISSIASEATNSPVTPRVWVVLPTIAIATDCYTFLNGAYFEYLQSIGVPKDQAYQTPLFGYRTGSGSRDTFAPIQFVTWGILPLLARDETLVPELDRILIDEAHKTLVVSESVELALAKLWEREFVVSYMSATVETKDLERKLRTKIVFANQARYPKYIHNSPHDLVTTVKQAIEEVLIWPNYRADFFPPLTYPHYQEVLTGVEALDRASGIMVVVDSLKGERSDAALLTQVIKSRCEAAGITIVLFSSSIRDNKRSFAKYEAQFAKIRQNRSRYVIITTNVVEMGVTIPDLDMVITKDTEIVNRMVAGQLVPVCVPLSAASFGQRAGRVGRKRAGLVAIAREMGTSFSTLSDAEINAHGLACQPLSFPLQRYQPYKLTYQTVRLGLKNPREIWNYLETLGLPSIDNEEELSYVLSMTLDLAKLYRNLGIDDPQNNEWVRLCEFWVGTPQYPFYLTALVEMAKDRVRGREEIRSLGFDPEADGPWDRIELHPRKYWLVFAFMGGLLDFPVSRLVFRPKRDTEEKRYSEIEKNPPEKPRKLWNHRVEYSDLATVANAIRPTDHINKDWIDDAYYHLQKPVTDIGVVEILTKYGWKLVQYRQALVAARTRLLEVFERLQKDGFNNPIFFQSFTDFFSLDEELIDYGAEWTSFHYIYNSMAYSDGDKYSDELYEPLHRLYRIIGIPFEITRIVDPRKKLYEISYEHQGQTITEHVSQRDHYVDLVVGHKYLGLLLPKTRKDQTEVHLKLQHYFKIK